MILDFGLSILDCPASTDQSKIKNLQSKIRGFFLTINNDAGRAVADGRAKMDEQVKQAGRWRLRKQRAYVDTAKDTQFSEAWVILGVLLALVGLVAGSRFLTSAAMSMFVVAAASWTWNEFSLTGLDYSRSLSERRAFLDETVTLTLTTANRKLLPLTWLNIVDVFPLELEIEGATVATNLGTNLGEFRSFWMLNPLQRTTRTFTIQCNKRGFHTFGPAVLSTGDGFGFFSTTGMLPKRDRLIIYPHIYPVAELRLPSKNPFGERGAKTQLFEDPLRTVGIREWQSSDSLRRVHWKATARHQAMLSRVYEPSEETQVLIFLNSATLKRHWLGSIPALFERAISVAASLASLAAEQRLPVGLITNGVLPASDQPLRLLPGRSPDQLLRILEMLAAVSPFNLHAIEELILREAPKLPWGATLVVVTAIAYDELLSTLMDLAAAGRRIVLFTLAEEPPKDLLPHIKVYHLPHLVRDIIAPLEVQP